MKTAQEHVDEIEAENKEMSLTEWLDLLNELKDEIETRIENVESDIENNQSEEEE